MAYGDSPYGGAAYGEAAGGTVITTVAVAVAVAAGLSPTVEGDTYTVPLPAAVAIAQGLSPSATQQAIVAVPPGRAIAVGLSPTLSGVTITVPAMCAKAAGLPPAWTQVISGGTDSTNALDGRSRGGLATGSVTRPVAPVPAGLTLGEKYDKTIAYPTPVMVNGRPT